MSFLNGTTTVLHSSPLPSGATREQGVAMLQDHEFFLRCDPHLVKFTALPAPDSSSASEAVSPPLPERMKPLSPTKYYEVQDLVHNLPGGLWDSNVTSTYEMTDIEGGLFVRIRSPMSIVMDTFWEIKEVSEEGKAASGGGLEMVEDITINASRLILPVVKSLCEGGWKKIHDKMLGRLSAETDQRGAGATASQPAAAASVEVQVQAS